MWNKSISVAPRCVIIIGLLLAIVLAGDLVSARSLSDSEGHSCSAIKGLLDTIATPAATTQKGDFPPLFSPRLNLNKCVLVFSGGFSAISIMVM